MRSIVLVFNLICLFFGLVSSFCLFMFLLYLFVDFQMFESSLLPLWGLSVVLAMFVLSLITAIGLKKRLVWAHYSGAVFLVIIILTSVMKLMRSPFEMANLGYVILICGLFWIFHLLIADFKLLKNAQ